MKIRKRKEVEIELSKENYEGLKKIAKKSGLKWQQVANIILVCELDITAYIILRRSELFKRLKIKPTKKLLFHRIFLPY